MPDIFTGQEPSGRTGSESDRPAIIARIYELGMTVAQVAALYPCSTHQIYRFANGESTPQVDEVRGIDKVSDLARILQWPRPVLVDQLKAAQT